MEQLRTRLVNFYVPPDCGGDEVVRLYQSHTRRRQALAVLSQDSRHWRSDMRVLGENLKALGMVAFLPSIPPNLPVTDKAEAEKNLPKQFYETSLGKAIISTAAVGGTFGTLGAGAGGIAIALNIKNQKPSNQTTVNNVMPPTSSSVPTTPHT